MVIAAAAVVAPLLSELFRRWRIPSVLFELLLGIVVGPSVLGWVELGGIVDALSQFGLALLFFMAGYEIDFARLRGAPLNRALTGWGISLVLGLGVGAVLAIEGFVISSLMIGLALTTTAIGTLLPILRDRGLLGSTFGSYLTAAGAVGEFGPIVAVTILLSAVTAGDRGAAARGLRRTRRRRRARRHPNPTAQADRDAAAAPVDLDPAAGADHPAADRGDGGWWPSSSDSTTCSARSPPG